MTRRSQMQKSLLHVSEEYMDQHGKIKVNVYDDEQVTMKAMAKMMVDGIVENNQKGKKTLYIVPVGPVNHYQYFVQMVNENKVSLKNVTFINMDEYMEDAKTLVSKDHELSFRGFMDKHVYSCIDQDLIMPEEQRIFPSTDNDTYIDQVIDAHGGVDCCFGGIGINGHIAFNEPPEKDEDITEEAFKNLGVRVQKIARETRVVNGIGEYDGAFELIPHYCVTVGFSQILRSKKVRLFCMRNWHKGVVKRAVFEKASMYFPVSLLQDHRDIMIGIHQDIV